MGRPKQPGRKKVNSAGKEAMNRALRRAPEKFRLLVDSLNAPGLQLSQAKKILNRFINYEGGSFSGLAARTLKKVLDRLTSLGANKGEYKENSTTFEKLAVMLSAEGIYGNEDASEKSESEDGSH